MSLEILTSPEIFFGQRNPYTDHDDSMAASKKIITDYYHKNVSSRVIRKPADIQHYHKVREWAQEDGYPFDEANQIEFSLWMNPDILFQAEPVPGAREVSFWMYDHDIGLPVLTSRLDYPQVTPVIFRDMRDATVAWYELWMPWVPADDIHLQGVNNLPGDIYKAWMIKLFRIGAYFEDNTDHAGTILTYTNALVTLLSDKIVPSHMRNPNLITIRGCNGDLPNLCTVADYLHCR
jgi:hypothetical protein